MSRDTGPGFRPGDVKPAETQAEQGVGDPEDPEGPLWGWHREGLDHNTKPPKNQPPPATWGVRPRPPGTRPGQVLWSGPQRFPALAGGCGGSSGWGAGTRRKGRERPLWLGGGSPQGQLLGDGTVGALG